jgi:hypothetical protein
MQRHGGILVEFSLTIDMDELVSISDGCATNHSLSKMSIPRFVKRHGAGFFTLQQAAVTGKLLIPRGFDRQDAYPKWL